jgi:adenylate cyclase
MGRELLIVPVAGVGLSIVAVIGAFSTARSLVERRSREKTLAMFGRHVSPAISQYLLESSGGQVAGGAEQEATVMFVDIRGSTSMAEHRSPTEVVAIYNRFFGATLPVISAHGGLVNRVLGDGFLAVFGVPYPLEDHRQRALEAALEIINQVKKLNTRFADEGADPIGFGCGIHTGKVLAGNVGVADREEFTVIGDVVNTAARLQDLSKNYDANIVASAECFSDEAPPGFVGPMEASVKGRSEPVRLYYYPRSASG